MGGKGTIAFLRLFVLFVCARFHRAVGVLNLDVVLEYAEIDMRASCCLLVDGR